MSDYAELLAATNFSFLRGASHACDMVAQAHELELKALGIADRNTVAGVVRAYVAARDATENARDNLLRDKRAAGLPATLSAKELKATQVDLKLLVGARLVFADGTPDIVVYPETRKGWGHLTRLLTTGNLRAEKGDCILNIDDLLVHREDLLMIVLPGSTAEASTPKRNPIEFAASDRLLHLVEAPTEDLAQVLDRLACHSPGNVWLGATPAYDGRDKRRFAALASIARKSGVPLIAVGDALYASHHARPLQDVMCCIRLGITLATAGDALHANAERHLKCGDEMARLFGDHPEAIAETLKVARRIGFSLDQLRYEYPHEPVPPGWSPMGWLVRLTMRAARKRYGNRAPPKVRKLLKEEFKLIRDCDYPYYFLTVHDAVAFARSRGILCQGRGSAANSLTCFLLGITSIDPAEYNLLFSRFVSTDRKEPPDIDVDFEHERREEVMQYIFERYGRHRAGVVATISHFRVRGAVREVAKALGLTDDVVGQMTSTVWGSYSTHMDEKRFQETGFALNNPEIARLNTLVRQLINFPRHLGQHVGGFVLTEGRLDETVPIHNAAMKDRTFIEWDKDDIDALKLMKVDVLSLGMLTCIRKAFDLMRDNGLGDHNLEIDLKADDPAVYKMLSEGDSLGVFQVESRAQMNMLPRLKPEKLYDLVIQVAIVRPGPIQGNMVHPYLRRRQGVEEWSFPSPAKPHPQDELHEILAKTQGVPLFQEQAMKLAIVAAEFTDAEANQLRRAMATFRNVGTMPQFEEKMVGGMVRRGYEEDFARRCFEQIKGFGSYGFPESHALSFARLVYVSSWIKYYQPAVFCAALLNSQPMGFYAPAQIVRDAREHGVVVREIDVNASAWDNGIEIEKPLPFRLDPMDGSPGPVWGSGRGVGVGSVISIEKASMIKDRTHTNPSPEGEGLNVSVRLGFRQIDGFKKDWGKAVEDHAPYASIEDLARRANLPARALRLLADADALQSLGQSRREGLWEARRTPPKSLPLFAYGNAPELADEPDADLPEMPLSEEVVADYQMTRLSLKGHPMLFLREHFASVGVLSCEDYALRTNGSRAKVAGVVLVRQRPGKGNAIFVTLEDETGVCNLVLWARTFERFRLEVMAARVLLAEGEVQRSPEGVTHLMVDRVWDRTGDLKRLSEDHTPQLTLSRADVFEHPQMPRHTVPRGTHPRDVRILPNSRDFH